jgi:hypothetical protein
MQRHRESRGSHLRLTGRIMDASGSMLKQEAGLSRIGRRIRAAINPVSTAATRWWCHSALRRMLTGHGPTARQRALIRRGVIHGTGHTPSAEQMKARAAAIDELLADR